ncbi:unnamed protein product, partial [Discosporangium mesarthrocarpum]
IGCDPTCIRLASVLLREVLSTGEGPLHARHVVCVVPGEPTVEWKALLFMHPPSAVTYLNGDLSSPQGIQRARVCHAHACFVVSDRSSASTRAQDRATLLRALSIHHALSLPQPPCRARHRCLQPPRLLCMLVHVESRESLISLGLEPTSILCYEDIMERLLENACLHPGFSTAWSNVLSRMPVASRLLEERTGEGGVGKTRGALSFTDASAGRWELGRALRGLRRRCRNCTAAAASSTPCFPPASGNTSGRAPEQVNETEVEYLHGLNQVLLRFEIGRSFAGQSFPATVLELYRACGVVLFAVCTPHSRQRERRGQGVGQEMGSRGGGSPGCTRLNPGAGYVVGAEDVGFFISKGHHLLHDLASYCLEVRARAGTGGAAGRVGTGATGGGRQHTGQGTRAVRVEAEGRVGVGAVGSCHQEELGVTKDPTTEEEGQSG